MPRLGAEPGVAPAYPDRGRPNLRGGWLRQMTNTFFGTLLLLFIINILRKNYKEDTRNYLRKQGLEDKKVDLLVPKTTAEVRKEKELAKKTSEQQMQYLTDKMANLTKAVVELQATLVKQTGQALVHQIDVPPAQENGNESGSGRAIGGPVTGNGTGVVNAVDAGANGGGGADVVGGNLAVELSGADRESGNAGKSGESQDTDGNRKREGQAGRRLYAKRSMRDAGRRRDRPGRKVAQPEAKAAH